MRSSGSTLVLVVCVGPVLAAPARVDCGQGLGHATSQGKQRAGSGLQLNHMSPTRDPCCLNGACDWSVLGRGGGGRPSQLHVFAFFPTKVLFHKLHKSTGYPSLVQDRIALSLLPFSTPALPPPPPTPHPHTYTLLRLVQVQGVVLGASVAVGAVLFMVFVTGLEMVRVRVFKGEPMKQRRGRGDRGPTDSSGSDSDR
jgi:hypothetical protein